MKRKAAMRKPRRAPKRARIGRIYTGDEALHELFREQAAAVLEDAAIGEEEKQSMLAAMTCPCCGAGSMSFSVSLKPKRGKFAADES
jgi:hypothetical protein